MGMSTLSFYPIPLTYKRIVLSLCSTRSSHPSGKKDPLPIHRSQPLPQASISALTQPAGSHSNSRIWRQSTLWKHHYLRVPRGCVSISLPSVPHSRTIWKSTFKNLERSYYFSHHPCFPPLSPISISIPPRSQIPLSAYCIDYLHLPIHPGNGSCGSLFHGKRSLYCGFHPGTLGSSYLGFRLLQKWSEYRGIGRYEREVGEVGCGYWGKEKYFNDFEWDGALSAYLSKICGRYGAVWVGNGDERGERRTLKARDGIWRKGRLREGEKKNWSRDHMDLQEYEDLVSRLTYIKISMILIWSIKFCLPSIWARASHSHSSIPDVFIDSHCCSKFLCPSFL